MKRKMDTPFVMLVVILLIGLFASACGSSGNDVAPDGKSLLEDRCTECHTLSRVEKAAKTRDGWSTTISRMVSLGAELNSEEREILLDYLESTYPQ